MQFIIIFLTQDDYYPAIKFDKQNTNNIAVEIDPNEIYDSNNYNSNGYDLEYTFTCYTQLPENFICSIEIPLLNSTQKDIKIFSSYDSEKMAENYTSTDSTSASIFYSLFTPHLITEYITHIYLAENISDKVMFITDDYQFRISRI